MDPSQSRAALELAQVFHGFENTPLDEQIAAYYSVIAGFPAPDLGRRTADTGGRILERQ